MPDLIAQGSESSQRWRRKLPADVPQVIGRSASPWSVPWDDRISRRHVEVCLRGRTLHVKVLEAARNPVFFRGRQVTEFDLHPGEHFVIGGTSFTLADERAFTSLEMPLPASERTFSVEELRRRPYRRADERIEVLSRLPDIISGSSTDEEMLVRLVNLLLSGVPRATAAAVVALQPSAGMAPATTRSESANRDPQSVSVLHWDRRMLSSAEFRPSERLIRRAIETGESVVHVWSAAVERGGDYTLSEGVDWAFCVTAPGQACAGWGLYVTGAFADGAAESADAESLRDDLKFTELTAATLGSLREARLLARRQAALSQFFSPAVLDALANQDAEAALAPREAPVTVLFCDLRGFSRESERHAGRLHELLERVSQALGVMTRQILDQGGVIGDFHGDSAMGFWGWPLPQHDAALRACRAALAIRKQFASAAAGDASPLAGFRVGIGIASGRAVAGKIGTVDQVKVTVFGPVVNLAARLEELTKVVRVPILVDEPTAAAIKESAPRDVARMRKLARVKPRGLEAAVELSELVPPATDFPDLSDEHLAAFDAAVEALQAGDWPRAIQLLHLVPPDDLAKDFLTVFIAQHNRVPPANWDGTIPLG
jgi:adenylate cyclase